MESPKVMVSSDPRPVTTIGVRGAGSAVSVGFASLPPKGSSQVKSVNVLGTEQDQTSLPQVILARKPSVINGNLPGSLNGSRRGSLKVEEITESPAEVEKVAARPMMRQGTKFPYLEIKRQFAQEQ
jgi:hypothetical protein